MGSRFFDIEKALLVALEAVDNVTPMETPNNFLSDKPEGLWFKVFNARAASTPVTLGSNGEDDHRGFLQVDINYPQNLGAGDVLEKADEIASAFPAGRNLAYNGQNVTIRGASLGPGRYIGGYYRVSVSINYYARTTR